MSMEVNVYEPPKGLAATRGTDLNGLNSRFADRTGLSTIIAALGAALVNGLFYLSVVTATNSDPEPAKRDALSGMDREGALSIMLIDHPQNGSVSVNSSTALAPLLMEAVHLEAPVLIEPMVDQSDDSEIERLTSIYLRQIAARIDRVLQVANMRPRSLCSLLVTQELDGTISDVDFDECPKDVLWRQQLAMAIRQASPLPAPPRADIYRHSIRIKFDTAIEIAG